MGAIAGAGSCAACGIDHRGRPTLCEIDFLGAGRSASVFQASYFRDHYRDYERQNPSRKLAWYLEYARPWLPEGKVTHLDIGCGLGALLEHSSTRDGHVVHGSDISKYAVGNVKARLPGVDARVGTAEDQLWPDGSFSLITMMDVLEHLEDPEAALVAARHQMASGGTVLVAVPVYDGLSGPIIGRLDSDPTHIHKWRRQAWLDLISSHFEIRRWTGVFRLLPPAGPYLHLPSTMLRRHTPAIVVVAG